MKSEVVWMESGFLGKNDPLWKDFENFVAKGFMRTQKHVLCANFVKFGRSEVGEIPRCLHDKKIGSAPPLAYVWIAPKICHAP